MISIFVHFSTCYDVSEKNPVNLLYGPYNEIVCLSVQWVRLYFLPFFDFDNQFYQVLKDKRAKLAPYSQSIVC